MVQVGYAIADIVPHAGAMCLLHRAIVGDEESLVAEVDIVSGSLFESGGGVPAWVGIEFMAQTIAAWAGWRARLRDELPKKGFLLGTRHFASTRSLFQLGETLSIHIHRELQTDHGIGQFSCHITIAGAEVARAAITVFEPEDSASFEAQQRNTQ